MKNQLLFLPKIIVITLLLTLVSCHDHDHCHIDPRDIFLGQYHAVESFVNPVTGYLESYHYDLEVVPSGQSGLEIVVTGYGNGGIYGTSCSLVGTVRGNHIDIPSNICYYDHHTSFEIDGFGDLSPSGHYLNFELHIHRCDGPICGPEPLVTISAHRL